MGMDLVNIRRRWLANIHSQLSKVRRLVFRMNISGVNQATHNLSSFYCNTTCLLLRWILDWVLYWAVEYGTQAIVQLLVGAGADVNRPGSA